MDNESIFGHLALRFSASPENLATEGLRFILEGSNAAHDAFVQLLRQIAPELPETLTFQTQAAGDEGEIPDLIGLDAEGNEVFLGEAKFWAGLTGNQPVSYLRRLEKNKGKLLLFIAPGTRFETLWPELLMLCKKAKLEHEENLTGKNLRAVAFGSQVKMGMTSWRAILNTLQAAAEANNEQGTASDLAQLRGLCERMDASAFLPLRQEEMACEHGKRIGHYIDVVNDSIAYLESKGTISTKGLRATTRADGWGRYFKHKNFGCILMFNFKLWGEKYPTPIWINITNRIKEKGKMEWVYLPATEEKLRAYGLKDPLPIQRIGKEIFIPIILPTLEEKQAVVAEVARQMETIFAHLSDEDQISDEI